VAKDATVAVDRNKRRASIDASAQGRGQRGDPPVVLEGRRQDAANCGVVFRSL
jgi:hypothetical protein